VGRHGGAPADDTVATRSRRRAPGLKWDGVGQDAMGNDSPYQAGEARWFYGGNDGVPALTAAPVVVDGGGSALQHRGREEGVRHTGNTEYG
jgi:hypothetical protein